MLELVTPELFSNEIYQLLARHIIEYWRHYGRPPGKIHTADLVARIIGTAVTLWRQYLRNTITSMIVLYDNGINTEYVMDEMNEF